MVGNNSRQTDRFQATRAGPALVAPAQIDEPIDSAHHQTASNKIADGCNDNIVHRTTNRQPGIGCGILPDGDPEIRTCPRFIARA